MRRNVSQEFFTFMHFFPSSMVELSRIALLCDIYLFVYIFVSPVLASCLSRTMLIMINSDNKKRGKA